MENYEHTAGDAMGAIERALLADEIVRQTKCIEVNGQIAVVLTLQKDHISIAGQSQRDIISRVRKRVRASTQIRPLPKQWFVVEEMPLTVDGALDESKLKDLLGGDTNYEKKSNDFPSIANGPDASLRVAFAVAHDLPVEEIDMEKSFIEHGGDSMSAIRVMVALFDQGFEVTVAELIRAPRLADVLLSSENTLSTKATVTGAFRSRFGEPSELPKLLWSASTDNVIQTITLRLPSDIRSQNIQAAVTLLSEQYTVLRPQSISYALQNHSSSNIERKAQSMESSLYQAHQVEDPRAMDEKVSELRLQMRERISVFEVHLFELENPALSKLVLMAHTHFLDKKSWSLLLDSLARNILQPQGHESGLSAIQKMTTEQDRLVSRLRYASAERYLHKLPTVDHTVEIAIQSFSLDGKSSHSLLETSHDVLKTRPIDFAVTALTSSYEETFGSNPHPVIVKASARDIVALEEMDFSQTVGQFGLALRLDIEPSDDAITSVSNVKDALRTSLRRQTSPFHSATSLSSEAIPLIIAYEGHREGNLLEVQPGGLEVEESEVDTPSEAVLEGLLSDSVAAVRVYIDSENAVQFEFVASTSETRLQDWMLRCRSKLQSLINDLHDHDRQSTLSDYPLLQLTSTQLITFEKYFLSDIRRHDPQNIELVYPCSSVQEGMILARIKSPESYRIEWTMEVIKNNSLDGTVDIDKLCSAWRAVIQRHAALRTIFLSSSRDGSYYEQVVLRKVEPIVVFADCIEKDPVKTLQEQKPAAFTLLEPAHQLSICTSKDGKVFCKLELSHTIIDGLSLSVILRDMRLYYSEKLPQTSLMLLSDHLDYVSHQRKSVEYWKSYIGQHEYPKFPSLNQQSGEEASTKAVFVDLGDAKKIQASCKAMGITVASLIKAAWALVLRYYTQSDAVCFGYMNSGRDAPVANLGDAVGVFVRLMICCVDFSNSATISQTLKKIQTNMTDSAKHQYCSLADIHSAVGVTGGSLFNTLVSLVHDSNETPDADIAFNSLEEYTPTEYPITVVAISSASGLRIRIGYDTTTLSNTQAESLAQSVEKAVSFILNEPKSVAMEGNLLSDYDMKTIEQSYLSIPEPMDALIHDLISKEAASHPDFPAIDAHDGKFTYAELEELTTTLAKHLQSHYNIGPEKIVVCCFEKSAWAVVAMVAILKAGSGFVSVEPSHPKSRLSSIATDAQATLVLTSAKYSHIFSDVVENVVEINATAFPTFSLRLPSIHLSSDVIPSNVAYVIFTSGST
ncbi:hypothetical protein ACHAQJ_001198, partial [Trichoderma viride]